MGPVARNFRVYCRFLKLSLGLKVVTETMAGHRRKDWTKANSVAILRLAIHRSRSAGPLILGRSLHTDRHGKGTHPTIASIAYPMTELVPGLLANSTNRRAEMPSLGLSETNPGHHSSVVCHYVVVKLVNQRNTELLIGFDFSRRQAKHRHD